MAPMSRTPVYNVKAVVRETGLTPDLLRAWERRYGVPSPQRSPGGHRLYSQRDIELLKWLVARKREGLSISHAIELWENMAERGLEPAPPRGVPAATAAPGSGSPDALRDVWVSRCLAFDELGAESILAQGFSMYTPEIVAAEVLQRGLTTIDERWYRGEASVQQIYFAAQLGARRLDALLVATPPPTRPARLLLGCPPEELHTFGSQLLSLLLRRQGWDVLYLGANLPLDRLEITLAHTQPNLVVLSAQQLFTAATLVETGEAIARAGSTLAYGGRIFNLAPSLRRRIHGHFLGERLSEAPIKLEGLIYGAPEVTPPELPSEAYREALIHYRLRQPLIDADLRLAASAGVPDQQHANAYVYLTRGLEAALALGNIQLLDGEIDWLRGLLAHRHIPDLALRQYLAQHHRAAQAHLDEPGRIVVDWLGQTLEIGLRPRKQND
jgi:MerR family transcriptional regulator, light-induced transcriptional regulator